MAKTYDLKRLLTIVGTFDVKGYGDGDAVSIEWDSDLVEITKKADGGSVYSRLNDRGCMITFTLNQTSPSIPLFQALIEVQHGDQIGIAPPAVLPTPFFMFDPVTGDQWNSAQCVVVSRPAPSKGRTIGDVTIQVHMEECKYTAGSLNAF